MLSPAAIASYIVLEILVVKIFDFTPNQAFKLLAKSLFGSKSTSHACALCLLLCLKCWHIFILAIPISIAKTPNLNKSANLPVIMATVRAMFKSCHVKFCSICSNVSWQPDGFKSKSIEQTLPNLPDIGI